ncbi:MAG: DUF362 domain-containing protein [Bacteroidales bacterium]|nr:DUF362 domain-containing protein [Bacteroidales bacterium]
MSNSSLTRREFMKQSGALGVASLAGAALIPGIAHETWEEPAVIASVRGSDYYRATLRAVEVLGGMEKFVPHGSSVGLLINSDFEAPGAYVHPDISIAALRMIQDAGAGEIWSLQQVKEEYWKRSSFFEENRDLIGVVRYVASNVFPATYNEEDFVRIKKIPGSVSLGEVEVVRKFLECDVFINIPICKHHPSTLLTCALKNLMGINSRKSNITFHLGSGVKNDPEFLGQCIADLNLLRKTDLVIVDATRFITTNGPSGPGEILHKDQVVAGTDPVAVDATCTPLLGYDSRDVISTVRASGLGIGRYLAEQIQVIEYTL